MNFEETNLSDFIYLDYNSTKPADREVVLQVIKFVNLPLNPSSSHQLGKYAKNIIDKSKKIIKNSIKSYCHEIVFCSTGTESVNMAFNSLDFENIFCLSSDHECSINHPKSIPIGVDTNGVINLDDLKSKLIKNKNSLNLVSFCIANNQSGVIQPVKQIVDLAREFSNTLIHCDCVQFATKDHFTINEEFDFDFVSISSHKIGALAGGSMLIYKNNLDIKPMFFGGSQQGFKRPGTENVLAIASSAIAMQMFNEPNYINSYKNHTLSIQKKLENFLENQGCVIFANQSKRLTNTTFFAMQNCKNSIQLVEYDLNNIFVSTGSACSSGKIATSHVLQSMNIPKNLAENAIRISTDLPTTNEQIEKFFNVFLTIKARL